MSAHLLGLRTVIYPVDDLEASKLWWSTFLGVEPYFDEPFYVGFSPGGYELGLLPDADPEEGVLTYWGVDNVDDAIDEALEAGASLHGAPTDVGEGIITATIVTPDGSIVGLIYNPFFEAGD